VIQHPRVQVTDVESRLGTQYTAATIAALQVHYPAVRFIWLMGADNLAQFHQWSDWRWIMENVHVGVLARPGDRISARMSPAARLYSGKRIPGRMSHLLTLSDVPAWCFVNVPMIAQSSTAIRAAGGWQS
jgi:nicotinate-nucleotide adenylyltransferase